MAIKAKRTKPRETTKPAAPTSRRRVTAEKTARKALKPKRKKPSVPRLDLFADGYVEAALFADLPEGADAFLPIHPACWAQIAKDCARFQRENRKPLKRAYEMGGNEGAYNEWSAGRDFWLSRQGHGISFWSRGLDEVGDQLHEAASNYPGVNVLTGEAVAGHGDEYIFIE